MYIYVLCLPQYSVALKKPHSSLVIFFKIDYDSIIIQGLVYRFLYGLSFRRGEYVLWAVRYRRHLTWFLNEEAGRWNPESGGIWRR